MAESLYSPHNSWIGSGFHFETGDTVVVNIIRFEIAQSVIEGEHADVPAVVNVIPAHHRIGMVFHPHSSESISANDA